jgi:hypothetical protein
MQEGRDDGQTSKLQPPIKDSPEPFCLAFPINSEDSEAGQFLRVGVFVNADTANNVIVTAIDPHSLQ